MAEDNICRLVDHLKSLNLVLDAGLSPSADHLRTLKMLRYSLTNLLHENNGQLKDLQSVLKSFSAPLEPTIIDLAPFLNFEKNFATATKSFEQGRSALEKAGSDICSLLERAKKAQELGNSAAEDAEPPRTHWRPPTPESEELSSGRVLIVDDIPVSQKVLSKQLKKLNLESDFASNGKEAVEMAQTGNYDLIFMDCDMPVMNGFEATIQIRRDEINSGRHVPIIAMTSYDRGEDRQRCLSSGMDEYLSKGASGQDLKEMVEWCLKRGFQPEEKQLNITDYEEELDLLSLSKTYEKRELNELLDTFMPSINTLMRCLRSSMDERDVRSIGHFAYSLKGPFASLGMQATGRLTARLTNAAEEKDWEEANDSYDMLCRNCESMRRQLEERQAKS